MDDPKQTSAPKPRFEEETRTFRSCCDVDIILEIDPASVRTAWEVARKTPPVVKLQFAQKVTVKPEIAGRRLRLRFIKETR